jgi:hypothetical protein
MQRAKLENSFLANLVKLQTVLMFAFNCHFLLEVVKAHKIFIC